MARKRPWLTAGVAALLVLAFVAGVLLGARGPAPRGAGPFGVEEGLSGCLPGSDDAALLRPRRHRVSPRSLRTGPTASFAVASARSK